MTQVENDNIQRFIRSISTDSEALPTCRTIDRNYLDGSGRFLVNSYNETM